jgi:hypothetical protein
MMELNGAMMEGEKHKESREHKRVEEFNTDKDIIKGRTSFEFDEDKEVAKVFDTTFEFQEDEEFDKLINNTSFNIKEDSEIDGKFGDITRESFTDELRFHTGRLKEEEEFANMFYTTTFKCQEDDEFDRLFNNITLELKEDERFAEMFDSAKGSFATKFEEPANKFIADKFEQNLDFNEVKCPVLRRGCKQEEFEVFAKTWRRYAGCQWEMDDRELRQQLLNCAVGPLELIMYNNLGSKLDTLSETDLMQELEKLAVVKSIAEQQDVDNPAMVYANNPALVYMENTAKPTSHRSPAHSSLTHRSPAHSSHQVHSQSIHEEKANDKVLAIQVQEDLVAEDQAN